MKKQIALLAVAVGLAGSAFADCDKVGSADEESLEFCKKGPLVFSFPARENDDPGFIKASVSNLVAGGHIKLKDGVKIAWADKGLYLVVNEKTGSHFLMTNMTVAPVSIKGLVVQDDELKEVAVSSRKYIHECRKSFDSIKKVECMLNFAATL